MKQKRQSAIPDSAFAGATWVGAEEEGIRYFRALPFSKKFDIVEQMCEVAAAIMPPEALARAIMPPRTKGRIAGIASK